MTQDRRITDKHPARPLDWENTEPLAGQQWRAPEAPASAKVELSGLQRYDLSTDHAFWVVPREAGQLLLWADVERLLAAPASAAAAPLLTDEQITDIVRRAIAAGEIIWSGFKKDDNGEYTVPDLTPKEFKLSRVIERATLGASTPHKLPEGGEAGDMPPVASPVSLQGASGEVLQDHEIFGLLVHIRPDSYGMPGCGPDYQGYDLACARAIEAEVQRRCRAQRTNNEVSRDAIFESAAMVCDAVERDWIDNSNRDAAAPLLREAAAKIRAMKGTPAPAPAGGDAWIRVQDGLPEHQQSVAFVVDTEDWSRFKHLHGRVYGGTFNERDGCFCVPGISFIASHWMPLPQAPSAPVSSGVVGEATGND